MLYYCHNNYIRIRSHEYFPFKAGYYYEKWSELSMIGNDNIVYQFSNTYWLKYFLTQEQDRERKLNLILNENEMLLY